MRAIRPLPALLLLTATLGGCATWNDRYTSNWQSFTSLVQMDAPIAGDWPYRNVPDLPAMYIETTPERRTPPGNPSPGWPPLAPVRDDLVDSGNAASPCDVRCEAEPRATAADPVLALRSELPLSR